MTDIVERLKVRRAVDGSVVYVEMPEQVLDDAIYEIERLRSKIERLREVAGAVSVEGHSYADIRRMRAEAQKQVQPVPNPYDGVTDLSTGFAGEKP